MTAASPGFRPPPGRVHSPVPAECWKTGSTPSNSPSHNGNLGAWLLPSPVGKEIKTIPTAHWSVRALLAAQTEMADEPLY